MTTMSPAIYIHLLVSSFLAVESVHLDSSLEIVGGQPVNITEVPFMARYGAIRGKYFCGATIVHSKFLITSAFCYYEMKRYGSNPYVILGTDDRLKGGEKYDVEDGFPHPYYDPDESDYDVAVLKVAKPLTFRESVKAIALANIGFEVPVNATFDILGFGTTSTSFDLKFPDKLQKVTVQHMATAKCKAIFLILTDRMICTIDESKGSCSFDEGGPLVYKNSLLGVTTSFVGCGRKNHPTIYTYIPKVRDFIDSIIQN